MLILKRNAHGVDKDSQGQGSEAAAGQNTEENINTGRGDDPGNASQKTRKKPQHQAWKVAITGQFSGTRKTIVGKLMEIPPFQIFSEWWKFIGFPLNLVGNVWKSHNSILYGGIMEINGNNGRNNGGNPQFPTKWWGNDGN